ncbi:MAG TPA: hypothetical protein PKD85_14800, partial [Saprospiraceae bacterium]|nr:hypothetical protein [Saprospiraceae bacterium]
LCSTKMIYKTTEEIQQVLEDQSQYFDQTMVINSNFGEAFTLALMAVADLNVVCIDTRLTPAKKIIEVDLIQQEYKLPNVHFVVNRVGYNPSFIFEIVRTFRKSFLAIKNKISK